MNNKNIYDNNLLLYKVLKYLIQAKYTPLQQQIVREVVEVYRDSGLSSDRIREALLREIERAIPNKNNTSIFEILNLIKDDNRDILLGIISLAIDLIQLKNYILSESQAFVENVYSEDTGISSADKLSLAFDTLGIDKPYGVRVISSLLVYSTTDISELNIGLFLTDEARNGVNKIKSRISRMFRNYGVNTSSIFSIIVAESVSQSIRSTAGSSYESRVESVLSNVDSNIRGHSHDSNIRSVEYDFTFKINDKTVGVSAKRTLRERYKQNFEDNNLLGDVDYMALITLGIDLNKDKMDNILAKEGIFIIVAGDVYDMPNNEHLRQNSKIIPSYDLNANKISDVISIL